MSNTEQKQKILLKRTTEVDRPSIPSGASHGELFLNIASGANAHNKISTMQIGTNNPIIWSDDVANEKKFASKTELENLIQEVEDSEFVIANALTQINKSAGFTEGGSSVLEGGMSLSEAIIDLQARAGVIEESDPIFAKSAASGITSADITNWNNKMDFVDRVSSAFTSYSATTSTKAIQDGDGNVITTTYSTKAELSGAVNDIIEEIIDNELVTSTAISTMNASAGFNEDGSSVLEGGVSLSEAIIELQNKTQDLEESDPIFTDSPAAGIKLEDIENWNNSLRLDSPVIKGTATNSAVLNGTYLERDNQAISQLSMATGAGANAGLKGYYYEGIDFTNKKIYLSNKTTLPTTIKTSGFDTYSNFSCGYSVEDVISIVNGKKYDRCSKITAISNNVITLDSLPFTQDKAKLSLLADIIGEEIPNEFSVNVVKRLVDDYDVLSVTKHNVGTVDLGGGAHAEGVNTFATNIGAHAEGFQSLAYGQASHAEGIGTQASYASHAEGESTQGTGDASHAEGKNTIASGDKSHAEGYNTRARGHHSHAEGVATIATGTNAHAEGDSTTASGYGSHAEGISTIASGTNAHAEGELTQAIGNDSHAEGYGTQAIGSRAHAEGDSTQAIGKDSHAGGNGSIAEGDRSFAHGDNVRASGANALALGKNSIAAGHNSIAAGHESQTNNTRSFAMGYICKTEGNDSMAFGYECSTAAAKSAAIGNRAKSTNIGEFACGSYNATGDTQLFSVGCGTSDTSRKNAFHITNSSGIISAYVDNKKISTEGHKHSPAELGLESALKYHGVTTTPLTDGATTKPITIGGVSHYQSAGCVVIYTTTASGDTEFVWNGSNWEKLGDGINYKVKQEAVSDPAANGSALAFIDTISQDVNGKITVTKKNIPSIGEMNVQSDWSETDTNSDAYIKNKPTIPTKLSQLTDDVVTGKYLPITGGIINTAVGTPLNIKNTQSNPTEIGISFMYNNDSKGWIGYETQRGTVLYTYNGSHRLGIKDDGTAYVDSNTLIHSGNIKDQYVAGVYDSYNPLMKITFNYAGDAVTSNPTWLACWNGYTLSYVSPDNVKAGRATKLQTPRKLWGNDFDGTADVNGLMYVGNEFHIEHPTTGRQLGISPYWTILGYNNPMIGNPTYVDGRNVYIRYGNDEYASVFASNGNVGIGNTSPTERLDVSGNIKASGDITANKFIGSIRGNIIYDNGTDEGHFIGLGSNGVGVKGLLNYVYGNFPILFYTNGFERMRIGDYVGIGTTSPTEKLDVAGNVKATTFKGNLQGNADSATTAKSASTISAVTGTGQYYLLGHSTTGNGSYSVYKNSNVYMNNGSIFAASDRTLKTHIEDVDGSLDKIKRIPKAYFHWNNDEDKKRQMGTYAQDLEEVYPELVTKDKDGIRAVAYDRLGVVALAGIDKLYDMVQELMKKNDELEKRIKELEENK